MARVPAGNAVPNRRELHRELPGPPAWSDTCTCTESQGWHLGNLLPLFPCGNGDLAKIQDCTASAQPLHGGEMQVFCVAVQYCTVQEGHCSLLLCLQTAGSSWNNTQSILYLQWVKLLQPDFLSKRFPTSVRDSQPRSTATHEHTRLEHSHFST